MCHASSLSAIGFGIAVGLCAAATAASATDYFAFDLRGAELSPQPLGPATRFQPAIEAPASAQAAAAAGPRRVAGAVESHRVRVVHARAAPRPHRNPLHAFASYR